MEQKKKFETLLPTLKKDDTDLRDMDKATVWMRRWGRGITEQR